MSAWFEDNSLSIGHTPLVRLNRITLPDYGERYLSSVLFEGIFDAAGLPA
jgi:hypothetical protein